MGCDFKRWPDGSMGISCTRGRGGPEPLCQAPLCITPSSFLCDWPVAEGKTCDERMCARHAHRVARDTDYCPRHWSEFKLGRKVVD